MNYVSTRGGERGLSSAQCIVKGLAGDGGLYVPEHFPELSAAEKGRIPSVGYREAAKIVLKKYLTDFDDRDLAECVDGAYGDSFESESIAELKEVGDRFYLLELWHGPTGAFKDMALQLTPRLMSKSVRMAGAHSKTLVLTATSGDTGKAALEGFCGVEGTAVAVFYPHGGVSEVQRAQMVTQRGGNVAVAAVRGNFDDAQRAVKRLFADGEFIRKAGDRGWSVSSANSINLGRLVPQAVYYVVASLSVSQANGGAPVDFVVPTGNFGNILAAYYAKRMGAPVGALVCASNRNDVLTQFIDTGVYDRRREFYKTVSPSMDILVSSNLERLLFELCGRDGGFVGRCMADLASDGFYAVGDEIKRLLERDFLSFSCGDRETLAEVARFYCGHGVLIDTHTAVASAAARAHGAATGRPVVVVSTANPYKFADSVYLALTGKRLGGFDAVDALHALTGVPVPAAISGLKGLPELHTDVIDRDGIAAFAEGLL